MADDLEITLPEESEEPTEEVEEEEPTEEVEEEKEEKEEEEKEEKKEEKEEEEEEEEEEKSEKKLHARPTFRDIKEKFPDFFKTFPDLRNAFFREREYSKVFPTVEDARETLSFAESASQVTRSLAAGDPTLLLQQLGEANPAAFKRVADNFLPALHKLDRETFFNVANPLIERFIQSIDEEGQRTGDMNMRKAALVVGKFMTGEYKVPDSASKRKDDPERTRLEQERQQFYNERLNTSRGEVVNAAYDDLSQTIHDSLKEHDLTEFMRQKLNEEILTKVNHALSQDERHMALMNSLWRRWQEHGYSTEAKKRIMDAYLSRARQVIPAVRDKVLKDALLGKVKKITKPAEESEEVVGSPRETPESKKIDWRKTTDKDFLEGKITLRK